MRVLIVEDDRRLATSLKQALVEGRMAVDAVHDGESAMAAAEHTPYDVIVLDVMLPSMNGFEVTRRLRDRQVKAPILILTGRDAVDDRVTGLDSGADDYLVKPFALRELIARMRALARRQLSDRNAVLRAGNLMLDTASHHVAIDGMPVDLTSKEFAILEYFMINRGRLLSRNQVLQNVWSYDLQGGRNLVEVYIGRLRSKLTRAGAADPFVTVRGSGYRFALE
ncbi:MAG TPA: response regulator transcription factor [Candidatus Dormibacteraeota bacterium]|nr:response regulator transcription factor [Candidatus Dormibacteraeota bacterium]